jgi:O-antigen/teichoic acid export membrane protein
LGESDQLNRRLISGDVIARNSLYVFLATAAPLLISVVTIPYVVAQLGSAKFGLFSLGWSVLAYATVLDFGLGKATTREVAHAVASGQIGNLASVLWSSLAAQSVTGALGAIVTPLIAPWLLRNSLAGAQISYADAVSMFALVGTGLPVVACAGILRGALEGAQEFGVASIVRLATSAATGLAPLLGLMLGFDVIGIFALVIANWIAACAAYFFLCLRAFPSLGRTRPAVRLPLLKTLLSFGGWIIVCRVLIFLLNAADRFIVAMAGSLADASYYIVAAELAVRMHIIPASLTTSLFPAVVIGDSSRRACLGPLLGGSLKYILIVMAPIAAVLMFMSHTIFQIWLGSEYAQRSTLPFQILAASMIFNAVGHIPAAVLEAIGKPKLKAGLFALYAGPYFVALWFLTKEFGITGAAIAWLLRTLAESALFSIVSLKHVKIRAVELVRFAMPFATTVLPVLVFLMPVVGFVCGSRPVLRAIGAALVAGSSLLVFLLRFPTERTKLMTVLWPLRASNRTA